MPSQLLKAFDKNGNQVQIEVDLSKGLTVEAIPTDLQWSLKTVDQTLVPNTTEWIGGRERRG